MKKETESVQSDKNIEKLIASLKDKNCFFFTGSGISLESQIASVVDVLSHTCNKFLSTYDSDYSCVPQQVSRKDYICNKIQPELFYSVLLECAGKDSVLEMWNCLKRDHFTGDYCPKPNIIHYFVVAYSYIAHVPVFTMNYDKMLEYACEKLNIPFCVCVEAPPYESCQTQVIICKLHGNLKENSGNSVTQTDIGTTMSVISTKNSNWLEYIKRFMTKYDMCIWGYSGRDIDYYSFLREYATMVQRQIFWTIGYPEKHETDSITYDNAVLFSNSNIIQGYPSGMKKQLIEVLSLLDDSNSFVPNICELDKYSSISKETKEAFLGDIEQSIDIDDISFDSDIFWLLLMKATGHNKALGDIIKVFEQSRDRIGSLTAKEKMQLMEARIVLAREQADFSAYNQITKELMKEAKKVGLEVEERRRYLEIARVQYVSSLQMRVSSALALKVPFFRRKYGLLLLVRMWFAFLNYRFRSNSELYNENKSLAQECEIRSLAIDCGIPILRRRTIKKLKCLRSRAWAIGNYGTLIGTNKYLARLEESDVYEQEIKSFGTIVSDLSALSIINRKRDPETALKKAKENDNTLNIVKAIFSKKDMINKGEINSAICDEEKELLIKSIKVITPYSLRQTLLVMGKRENLFLE